MSNSGILTSDGRIVLGTTDGICTFTPPHDIMGNLNLYPVIITRFSLNGLPVSHAEDGSSLLSVPVEYTPGRSRCRTARPRWDSVSFRQPTSFREIAATVTDSTDSTIIGP